MKWKHDQRIGKMPNRLASADWRTAQGVPNVIDPHYLTPEHKAWRTLVISRAGKRCQRCGRDGCRLFADHIVERADSGADLDPANGQALCGRCHSLKTAAERAKRSTGRGGCNP